MAPSFSHMIRISSSSSEDYSLSSDERGNLELCTIRLSKFIGGSWKQEKGRTEKHDCQGIRNAVKLNQVMIRTTVRCRSSLSKTERPCFRRPLFGIFYR